MSEKILSICIPTYNREHYLKECLDSITSQLTDKIISDKVEIVIADNASTDNTEHMVREYARTHSNVPIIYFRNERNLGFDRSFVRLIARSTGKYCLSIGDDDAFFPDTISHVVGLLSKTTIPYMTLNNWGYDAHLKHPVLPHPNLPIKKDTTYPTLSTFVRSIKNYTDLVGIFVGLSGQVFLREPWNAFKDKEKYLDTLAVHMHTSLSIFNDKPYMIVATPIIKTRSSNIRWDVFSGLETSYGRVKGTIRTALWVKNTCHVPVSDFYLMTVLFIREYWFTGKEMLKRLLAKMGLHGMIELYRKLRNKMRTH